MDAAGAAAAVLARTSRRREAITPVLPLAVVLLFLSPLRESAARLPMVGRTSSMQCTEGTEKSGSGTTANWPTYHFMNNVTKDASGALLLEPLNDANAIAEYKGVYHVMMQEGGGNWSHGVSNDSESQPPAKLWLLPFAPPYLTSTNCPLQWFAGILSKMRSTAARRASAFLTSPLAMAPCA